MITKLIDVIKEDIVVLNQSTSDDNLRLAYRLEKYLKYLENDYAFEDYEFREICKYISSSERITDELKKDILLDLGYYYWVHNDHTKEEIEVVDENSVSLNEEDIVILLRKFGFTEDFITKLMSYKTEFEKLKKYSTIEKITGILNAFKSNSINANDFIEREKHLLQILIHSNENIINKIFEFIKEDIEIDELTQDNETLYKSRFREYLGHVTLFGERTRVFRNKTEKGLPSANKTPKTKYFSGTFLKYLDNREFLKKVGVKIKLDCLSTLEQSSTTIRDNYYLLRKYGFTNEDIERSLIVLSVAHLSKLIDLSIELGIFDKFKLFPSHYSSFNDFIAMRIKYCRLHNISIDGRIKGELSLKVGRQSKPFGEEDGGPEVYGEADDAHISFDLTKGDTATEKYNELANKYKTLLKIQSPTPLLTNMKLSDVEGDSISDIEYEYNYRKRYFENLIKKFDKTFASGELQYVFEKNGKKVIISRLKVHRNLLKLLYNEFTGNLSDHNFDYFSNILLFCIEKDSIITREEKMIIVDNIFNFADTINRESELARMYNGMEYDNNSKCSIDSYRRR